MKSNDIPNILEKFYTSNQRTILIDGPWGSGKTYQVKEFLKNNKNNKNKTYYISLFGKKTVDEINTELYNKIHPWRSRVKKMFGFGLSLINQSILPFDNLIKVDALVDSLEYSINDVNKKKFKKAKIIIFDDLERVNETLTYTSLLGYVNSLLLNKIKVMFLASSENMKAIHKDEFNSFNEKVLDRIYMINDTEVEIFNNYFNDLSITEIESIAIEFNNNIRQAQKASYLYKEIIEYNKSKKYDIFSVISPVELVRNCNLVVKLCFTKHEKPNITNTNDYFLEYVLKSDTKQYNENIANGLYKIRNNNLRNNQNISDNEIIRFNSSYITSLLNIFLYDDYTELDKIYTKEKNGITSDNLLEQNYFYLSDENKKAYSDKILKRFSDKEKTITNDELNVFASFIAGSNIEIKDEKISNITYNIINSFENNVGEVEDIFSTYNSRGKLDIWLDRVKYINFRYLIDKIKNNISNSAKANNYRDIYKTLVDHNYKNEIKEDEIKKFFIKNDFFLPNIYNDIRKDDWQYMHEITKYSKDNQLYNELKEVFMKLYEAAPNNNSLKERINSLTSKYFDEEIL